MTSQKMRGLDFTYYPKSASSIKKFIYVYPFCDKTQLSIGKMIFFSTEQQFYFKMEFQKLKFKYIATFIV